MDPTEEAAALCAFIKANIDEYKALQVELDVCLCPAVPVADSVPHPPAVVEHDIVIEEVVKAAIIQSFSKQAVRRTRSSSKQAVACIPLPPALTASKYGRIWDKWVAFSTFHEVEVMPPDVRALEIFLVNSAELSGSAGVALTAAAAVANFCALNGFASPSEFPRIGKILWGMRLTFGKAAKPKKPFTPGHIVAFMNLARKGTLREWRAALPLALCFLRGIVCFDLSGSNVVRHDGFVRDMVETSKNHPEGFTLRILVNPGRPNCVGVFLVSSWATQARTSRAS
jgi:hypothetical protein